MKQKPLKLITFEVNLGVENGGLISWRYTLSCQDIVAKGQKVNKTTKLNQHRILFRKLIYLDDRFWNTVLPQNSRLYKIIKAARDKENVRVNARLLWQWWHINTQNKA